MRVIALFLLAFTATYAAAATWDRFFIIMFENHGWNQIEANSYWTAIQEKGLTLTDFYAITHPSQPNYIAQIGGDLFNCKDDSNTNISAVPHLADLLERKGVQWKAYQEDYTPRDGGDCDPAANQNKLYYRKHNPFMSFDNIRNNKTRCQYIVPATQLDADVAANRLPAFSYYTPNIKNDAHDTDLDYAGKWLTGFLNKFMTQDNFIRNTMVVITFDEDEYLESNHITTILLGPYITKANSTEGTHYTHYSVTRTVEENWNLGSLNRNDATATSFLHAPGRARERTAADVARVQKEAAMSKGRPKKGWKLAPHQKHQKAKKHKKHSKH